MPDFTSSSRSEKPGCSTPQLGLRAAEMIEHDRHRRGGDEILDRGDHRQNCEQLDMPAARSSRARPRPESAARPTAGSLTPPVARLSRMPRMPARFMASRSASGVLSSITATPRAVAPRAFDAEQGRGIVGAVDARRHDHHALDMQRLVQRRHLLGRRRFRRIDAAGEERKSFGVAVNMGVAIAGAGGDVEIHRRRWLRGSRGSVWFCMVTRRCKGSGQKARRANMVSPPGLGSSCS